MAITRLGGANAITGTIPTSVAPGQGKVLQVVNFKTSTEVTTSSTSFSDTGLTASITPSSTSSKILISVHENSPTKLDNSDMDITLFRGTTQLSRITGFTLYTGTSMELYGQTVSTSYLDTPSTTSSTTYKTRFKRPDGSGTVRLRYPGESTITLMEIQG